MPTHTHTHTHIHTYIHRHCHTNINLEASLVDLMLHNSTYTRTVHCTPLPLYLSPAHRNFIREKKITTLTISSFYLLSSFFILLSFFFSFLFLLLLLFFFGRSKRNAFLGTPPSKAVFAYR